MSGTQTSAELTSFFRRIFRNCVQFSRTASIHFHFIDWRHVREMIDAGEGTYSELKNICVWDKGSGSLGAMYRSQHEFVLVFKSGRGRHVRNFATGEKGRYRTNIWKAPGMAQFGKGRAEELGSHPTPKSVPLLIEAIRDCSNPGDLIFDPFCGSDAGAPPSTSTRCISMPRSSDSARSAANPSSTLTAAASTRSRPIA